MTANRVDSVAAAAIEGVSWRRDIKENTVLDERWQKLKTLYDQARQLPAGERSGFLNQACGPDDLMRRELDSLLQHGEQADVEAFLVKTQFVPKVGGSITGTNVAHYVVGERIGVGGMGEVYRGMDTKLGRDVALKVLPLSVVQDRERRGRFTREARVLAALNHPHIAAIYGVEEAGDVCALVLELVEGPTLADRLQAGPIPLHESLRIARQLADALEAAHEKGIVHRDLKPANIKFTPKGGVKILDFGLAKALGEEAAVESPSVAMTKTRQGVILGTPAYMSPEQVTGQSDTLDARADIWAFGCVFYEMLAGRRPFAAESVSDMFAAILGREPEWGALPEGTPESIYRLLRRCLTKDPEQRLPQIADAHKELEAVSSLVMTRPLQAPRIRRQSKRALAGIATMAGIVLAGIVGAYMYRNPAPTETVVLNQKPLTSKPAEDPILHAAISPDGTQFVYNDSQAIYVQDIDTGKPVVTLGSDVPTVPPDFCFR